MGSFQNLTWEICTQLERSSSFIALTQDSLSLSSDIPTIWNSSFLYFEFKETKCGFSTLQGAHHDAQKFIIK